LDRPLIGGAMTVVSDDNLGCWAAGEGWQGGPLVCERLRLRGLDARDKAALIELAGDAEIAHMTAHIPHPFGPADADEYIAAAADSGRVVFAIERRDGDDFIGCIRIDTEGSVGDIGYWIGRPYWGAGYATEVVRGVLRLAFREMDLARVEAEVMVENPASSRVLEKAGFALDREAVGERGRCAGVPTKVFAVSREDWQARDAAKPVVLVVAVALVDADGRVLIARRPVGKRMGGLWEFPGGKVDTGETPETALIRELQEELGIDTRTSCLAPFTFASHEYEDFRLLMPLYVCRIWKGVPRAKEGQELAWVRPTRLGGYVMPPADEPLVAMLCDLL